jgi:class 3 adenylate cyclase/tetratricopeptide (TPR) repeat protein
VERKLATVVFADLAGSTELASRMDAEQLRDLLGDVYVTLARCAEAYGGTVEKFIGDAVMAVFGVPIAHEDDAERAVRAALLMRSRLAAVAERRGVPLVLRIGVNTGLVVTGTTPGRDFLVTGEAVNLAARLQQAAEPGEVLVGERTFRAVEPLVSMVAPRSLAVRGRTGPVTAYAVERFAPAGAYRRRRRPYGPFVGREVELTLLRTVIERAMEHSRAHLVTLIGEAGIGKSRLIEEVVVELRRSEEPPAVWVGRCLPYGEGGPYAPLRDLLLRAAAVRPDAGREEVRARVTGQLQAILPEGSGEQIAELLRFVGGERVARPGDDDEPGDRGRDAWRGLLLRMAARQATLLVIEDAHWAEPALLELIASVAAGDVRVPLVLVCAARPELFVGHPGWGSGLRNETTVTLEALEAGEMRRLATALAAAGEPPASVVDLAGGNPFFLEEILAMSGEGGGDRVPETVQGVIAARLDLLDLEDKRLLQRAAVVGRTFTLDQLEPLLDGGGRGPGRLRNLVERDLIHHRGGGRHSFKHALIRDVAYESIPRAERARLHLRLAEELESSLEAGCQAIAGHYAAAATLGEAAARAPAVRVLLQAAQEARSVEAHGLALRNAVLARQLADSDRERSLAAEAAGDAQWMAEHLDDARAAYLDALELGIAAELGPEDTSRLRWKWADLPTRWQGAMITSPDRERVSAEIEAGLAEARAAGSVLTEARLLIAKALLVYRVETTVPPQEAALSVADRALQLAEGVGRPAIVSAALDARSVLLQSVGRYAEALEMDERRLALIRSLPSREEQMDICSSVARTRTARGDFTGAIAAADLGDELGAGGDQRWLAWPARSKVDALFWWDKWDEATKAYERFLGVLRGTDADGRRARQSRPGRMLGVMAAIHLLRGETEAADRLESRLPASNPHFDLVYAHAMLGAGDPELALERSTGLPFLRPWARAIRAESLAMLGRLDEFDEALEDLAALPGVDELPRVSAQVDRARGIAGDEAALARAAEAFAQLGCEFEHARCLELGGDAEAAWAVYERMGASPAMERAAR